MNQPEDLKTLLEDAARACGIVESTFASMLGPVKIYWSHGKVFEPHLDDGDALRLAAKLCMTVEINRLKVMATSQVLRTPPPPGYAFSQQVWKYADVIHNDLLAATRLAILRCAAAIGKAMRETKGDGE